MQDSWEIPSGCGQETAMTRLTHPVDRYYAAYLAFFHREVETLGSQKTFVKYIMSDEAASGGG